MARKRAVRPPPIFRNLLSAASRSRWQDLVPPFLLLLVLFVFAWEFRSLAPQIDDAYISYRYARNLVGGHGLVYNLGERVEGFTNLLWTLLLAGGMALGQRAEVVAHLLGFASGLLLLVASYRYARVVLPEAWRGLAGLAPAIILASNTFASWTVSGLETPLFAAFTVLALGAQVRRHIGVATLYCILATLTRPEGGLLAAGVLGSELLLRFATDYSPLRDWRSWLPAAGYAGALGGLTVFRLAYYGDWVPNTFHAKVGGVSPLRGLDYVWRFIIDGPVFLLIPIPAMLAAGRKLWPGLGLAGAITLYVIAVGGDVFPDGRFMLPVLPILAVAALTGIAQVGLRSLRLAGLLSVCVPLSIAWCLWGTPASAPKGGAWQLSTRETAGRFNFLPDSAVRRRVEAVLAVRPRVELVALAAIGRFGFYSDLPILDLHGLVDPHVARSPDVPPVALRLPGHQRSNADYVFERDPDLILIPKRGRFLRLPAFLALWNDPRLDARYRWDPGIHGYRRR